MVSKLSIAALTLLTSFFTFAGIESFAENSRIAWDGAVRAVENSDNHHSGMSYAFGMDLHRVFSHNSRDIGTLVFQPYLLKLNNAPSAPLFFDNVDDHQLTWRIANFNYTALSKGGFNIRAGHFEVPFGLEQNIDTNGTLRQYTAADRGIKADWGVSANGVMPSFDYEVAISSGSGNEIRRGDSPYVFAGRIGSPSHKNIILGGSWFYGDVLGKQGITARKKLGLDLSYYYNQWEWLAELSIGDNDTQDTASGLLELSWRNAAQRCHVYVQLKQQQIKQRNWQIQSQVVAGLKWEPYRNFTLSGQYQYQVDDISFQHNSDLLSLQFRYRFE